MLNLAPNQIQLDNQYRTGSGSDRVLDSTWRASRVSTYDKDEHQKLNRVTASGRYRSRFCTVVSAIEKNNLHHLPVPLRKVQIESSINL